MTLQLAGTPLPVIGRARLYCCGITPYDTTHLGHAATFVWTDVVARVLEVSGVRVDLCRNVTDVDDDILRQAARLGVDYRVLGTEQTYRFEEDMRALKVRTPTFEPRSRDYIEEVVALARGLLERGAAYEREGNVFFKAARIEPFLADLGMDRDEAIEIAAERGGRPYDETKDDPLDVPVWQATPPQDPMEAPEPSWPSPWGPGRPGWHAECTAMAMSLLGAAIDVHSGGEDLRFPHHVYEAAQAEALSGVQPFARSWMHVGMVRYEGQKMAKSVGNLVYVADLLERWEPEAVRLHLISRPWADPWDFVEDDLHSASARLEQIWSAATKPGSDEASHAAAIAALEDDLNVPAALDIAEEAGGQVVRRLGTLLGIL